MPFSLCASRELREGSGYEGSVVVLGTLFHPSCCTCWSSNSQTARYNNNCVQLVCRPLQANTRSHKTRGSLSHLSASHASHSHVPVLPRGGTAVIELSGVIARGCARDVQDQEGTNSAAVADAKTSRAAASVPADLSAAGAVPISFRDSLTLLLHAFAVPAGCMTVNRQDLPAAVGSGGQEKSPGQHGRLSRGVWGWGLAPSWAGQGYGPQGSCKV